MGADVRSRKRNNSKVIKLTLFFAFTMSCNLGYCKDFAKKGRNHLDISTIAPRLFPLNKNETEKFKEREQFTKNISLILENLLKNYDNKLRPGYGVVPTIIETNIYVRSMGPISELDMTYSMNCYFRQSWTDHRLHFEGPVQTLSLNIKMLEKIWKPDTYFHNGQGSYVHTITTPNKLLRIQKNGTILYSMRLTIKAKCPMNLRSFPMDMQSCPLLIGSYGYPQNEILYRWDYKTVAFAPGMALSQFDLIGSPTKNMTLKMNREFSILSVNFKLQRNTGYFLIQVYVPCVLIVVLSWVSFWINREATADRVGLGITTVLTLSTFGLDSRTDLPKVHYATALDWFVIMCFTFVIATLLEFAGVHYFTKIGSGELDHLHDSDEEWEDVDGSNSKQAATERYLANEANQGFICRSVSRNGLRAGDTRISIERHRSKDNCFKKFYNCIIGSEKYKMKMLHSKENKVNSVSKIDKISRILFPATFGILNLFYWLFYTNAYGFEEDGYT